MTHQEIQKWWWQFDVYRSPYSVRSTGWYRTEALAREWAAVEMKSYKEPHDLTVWRDDFGGAK